MNSKTLPVDMRNVVMMFYLKIAAPDDYAHNPAPDRFTAHTDPDFETWEWDTALTPEQQEDLEQAIWMARRARVIGRLDYQQPVHVLRQWRRRTEAPTNAQRDMVLDALVEMWRITLTDREPSTA